jgi:hypothetical protein
LVRIVVVAIIILRELKHKYKLWSRTYICR